MDNRAATLALIIGASFLFWLHNTDKLAPIVGLIKSPLSPTDTATASNAPMTQDAMGRVMVGASPFSFDFLGAGFPGSVNK